MLGCIVGNTDGMTVGCVVGSVVGTKSHYQIRNTVVSKGLVDYHNISNLITINHIITNY